MAASGNGVETRVDWCLIRVTRCIAASEQAGKALVTFLAVSATGCHSASKGHLWTQRSPSTDQWR
eukprot:2296945-Pleurochrysis_carterae.AAC.1